MSAGTFIPADDIAVLTGRKTKSKQIEALRTMRITSTSRLPRTAASACSLRCGTRRGWGYTDLANPCEGIKGYSLKKRTVYITDAVYEAVYAHASEPLRDAMDLAYLTGQRPADALRMTEHDIIDGHLIVTQQKTTQRHYLRRGKIVDPTK